MVRRLVEEIIAISVPDGKAQPKAFQRASEASVEIVHESLGRTHVNKKCRLIPDGLLAISAR
jgi:hypothetical protein